VFYDTLSFQDHITSKGKVTDDQSFEQGLRGSGCGVIEVLSQNCHGCTEVNHVNPQYGHCPIEDLKWKPSDSKFRSVSATPICSKNVRCLDCYCAWYSINYCPAAVKFIIMVEV
jgi:hypothetical protein